MSMRSPAGDFIVKGLTFEAHKKYRYTWPGQRPAVASAEEMAAIVESSDPQLLDIHDVSATFRASAPPPPEDKP